ARGANIGFFERRHEAGVRVEAEKSRPERERERLLSKMLAKGLPHGADIIRFREGGGERPAKPRRAPADRCAPRGPPEERHRSGPAACARERARSRPCSEANAPLRRDRRRSRSHVRRPARADRTCPPARTKCPPCPSTEPSWTRPRNPPDGKKRRDARTRRPRGRMCAPGRSSRNRAIARWYA